MPNVSHAPDPVDQMFHGMQAMHNDLLSQMKSLAVPKIPIDPGAFLDEYVSNTASPISMTLQIDRPAVVDYILLSYTPVAAATLTIGQPGGTTRNIPIPSTTTTMPIALPTAMVVKPGDVLTLTCAGATAIFLEIMGRVISGTNWSQV